MKARSLFWGATALIVHSHVTYPLALAALERVRERVGDVRVHDERRGTPED